MQKGNGPIIESKIQIHHRPSNKLPLTCFQGFHKGQSKPSKGVNSSQKDRDPTST
jgi:hypothetical protein